jgi:hypothetical protein
MLASKSPELFNIPLSYVEGVLRLLGFSKSSLVNYVKYLL